MFLGLSSFYPLCHTDLDLDLDSREMGCVSFGGVADQCFAFFFCLRKGMGNESGNRSGGGGRRRVEEQGGGDCGVLVGVESDGCCWVGGRHYWGLGRGLICTCGVPHFFFLDSVVEHDRFLRTDLVARCGRICACRALPLSDPDSDSVATAHHHPLCNEDLVGHRPYGFPFRPFSLGLASCGARLGVVHGEHQVEDLLRAGVSSFHLP